ncbi:signal recognition particle-docking protein FtsY [Hoeflea sp. EC-HK425]|uniref:signal recognition particle-docking protein FtsY n=1 Tax=Hoeflea sp. EC-HK425 TaxID=2038388 RepID=UPI001259A711|nr:signal recognition particle-docking protein FtsY [Hoeflea sp. EC-HK425]VVT34667.1 Signal recognition particle receptor FtsY [Hoeflea sp. EC-HK425]
MALNFIKKVFSFGRNKEEAPAPEPAEETSAQPAGEEPVTDDAAATGRAFPRDGEMQFTPETAAGNAGESPAPADESHAGEPPLPASATDADAGTVESAPRNDDAAADTSKAAEEGVAPDALSSDPTLPAAPAPDAGTALEARDQDPSGTAASESLPDDGGAMQFTPETAGNAARPTPAPADEDHAGEPPLPVDASSPAATGVPEGSGTGSTDEVQQAPEDLTADPAIPPAPEPQAEPVASSEPSATSEPRRLVVRDTVSQAEPEKAPEPVVEDRGNWWQRLRQGLSRTSGQLTGQITGIFTKRKLDEETLEELEDILLQADLGVETAMRITDALSSTRYGKDISPAEVQKVMADEITRVLGPVARPLELDLSHKPHVILVVGVNGTGKTTTIGKLAAKLSSGGLKVTLAAGDTFRAAAIEQLKIWGERTGSKVVSTRLGADAAGLAYEAFETAREDGADVLIIDTAGRLQNRTELMDELAKVVRVIGKLDPEAPHTVLQTLDATTGQNALNQVEIFKNVAGVNGLVMTKLDGTARGGILVAIAAKHRLPVYFVGVGEGVDDLEPFEAADFASAIAGEPK